MAFPAYQPMNNSVYQPKIKEVKRSLCGFCSSGVCQLLSYIDENGRVGKVEPDYTIPGNPGPHCTRWKYSLEYMYDPNRINVPLKRVGARGEGKFEQISWEQALDEIAEKSNDIIKKYGTESIYLGCGTSRSTHYFFPQEMFRNRVGIPDYGAPGAEICYMGTTRAQRVLLGTGGSFALESPQSKCVFIMASNPPESWTYRTPIINAAKEAGAKFIVVDPRFTATAAMADLWLQIRYGTDGALLYGMFNVMIEEGLYDKEFAAKWTSGWDKFVERCKKEYPLQKCAEICCVPEEKIRQAARMVATLKPCAIPYGYAIEPSINSVSNCRLKFMLTALTGNFDVQGGDIPGKKPKFHCPQDYQREDLVPISKRRLQLGSDRFKLGTWPGVEAEAPYIGKQGYWKGSEYGPCGGVQMISPFEVVTRAMLTGQPRPIKEVIIGEGTMLLCGVNQKLRIEAIKQLELLVVVECANMTPDGIFADYVLPTTSQYERPSMPNMNLMAADVITGSVGDRALPKKVPGVWDRLDDYDFFRELGIRMLGKEKIEETWPWKTVDDWYSYIIEPLGYGTLKEFCDMPLQADGDSFIGRGYYVPPLEEKGYEKHGFGTPSGKVEVYSTVLEQLGYDPLPYWVEPAESPISTPEEAKEYPLILSTGGRHQEMHHGELFQISLARQLHPDPKMDIHPYTAREYNIGHGDWCWVETPIGRIKHRASWNTGINPGVIHIEHGWWFPEEPGQEPFLFGVGRCNASVIEDDDPDKANAETGMWTHKAMLCKVYRAELY